MVGVTNSMAGYNLMTEGNLIQLKSGGAVPQAGPGQRPDNNNHININIFGVSYKITIESQPQVLIKWFLIKKQRVYQTYDMKYLNAKKTAIKIKLKNDGRSNEKIKSLSFGKYIRLSYFLTS